MALATALAAAATIGGAILSSKAQKKAAKSASATAQNTADQNNALAQWMYNRNEGVLSPFQERGNAAGNAMNALLGLGVPSNNAGQATIDPNAYAAGDGGMLNNNPMYGGDQMSIMGAPTSQGYGAMVQTPSASGGYVQSTGATPQTGNALSQYQQAFDNYRGSTGYQFRLGQGQNAIGANYAARGVGNSGARDRSLIGYNQNMASGEFGNYLAQLQGQQGVGFSAASAQAGVGQNYVNTVSGNNDSAGTAAANAALLRGQSNANMYGSIAGAAGNLFGSSFGFGRG